MELVYLWVEEYKNIKKQGFNFSPRFECEFKDEYENYTDTDGKVNKKLKDNCELIIEEKKDYVSIFPENINVTAIVGENGSGKSSVLNIILNHKVYKYILLVNINNKLNLYKSESLVHFNKRNNFSFNIISQEIEEFKNSPLNDKTLFYILENEKRYYRTNEIMRAEIKEQIIETLIFPSINSELQKSGINNIPQMLTYDFNYTSYYDYLEKYCPDGNLNTLIDFIYELNTYDYISYLIFLISDNDLGKNFFNIFNSENNNLINNDKMEEQIIDLFKKEDIEHIERNSFEKLRDNRAKKIAFNDLEKELGENYFKLLFTDLKNFINVDIVFSNNASFNELSHGEQTLFRIFFNIIIFNKKEFYFFLDEPDNTLHPEWQRNFLSNIFSLCEKLEKKVHILITSHSPFILSDIPKQNVIFLEKDDKTGNCINASDKIDINPFGANINALLSHGFFMKDGLMGEFSKDKIKSIMKYHEEILKLELTKKENKIQRNTEKEKYEKDHKTMFWQIKSIIGDDYLKQVIKNHLIEIEKIVLGNDEAKKEEVKRLKAQIELLEK